MIWFCCGAVSSTCAVMNFSAVPLPRLENIDEEAPAGDWRQTASCAQPETPTESMEFLARSWSVSATELSRALLTNTAVATAHHPVVTTNNDVVPQRLSVSSLKTVGSTLSTAESVLLPLPNDGNNGANVAPRDSGEVKELFILHQALNSDFLNNQQILRNGLYKSIVRGKTMGRWMKDQKERKKQESRAHNAQLHAAVSVAGVAAAVAAVAASTVTFPEESKGSHKVPFKTSSALASAAALVASHCIDLAEEMGADHGQISAMVSSAVNARTNGDIMALTAGAATALRGAATLRARLQKGYAPIGLADDHKVEEAEKLENQLISNALDFVSRGGQLLKRTRKCDLHWKQVSFNINSNFQVIAKLKSTYMVGTFTKKKKVIVCGVYSDVPAWHGRSNKEDEGGNSGNYIKAYFGIKTVERVIEFECISKAERQMWTEGIQQMLNYCSNMT